MSIWHCPAHGLIGPMACCSLAGRVEVARPDDQQIVGDDGAATKLPRGGSTAAQAVETDNGRGVTSAGGESGLPHRATTLRDEIDEIRANTARILAHLRERDRGTNEECATALCRNPAAWRDGVGQFWCDECRRDTEQFEMDHTPFTRTAFARLAARSPDPRGSETRINPAYVEGLERRYNEVSRLIADIVAAWHSVDSAATFGIIEPHLAKLARWDGGNDMFETCARTSSQESGTGNATPTGEKT